MKTHLSTDFIESEATDIARKTLEGCTRPLSWRAAGYRTPRQAAEALVGDGYDDAVRRRAVTIVAKSLTR